MHAVGTQRYGTRCASSMPPSTLRRRSRSWNATRPTRGDAARRTGLSAAADDLLGERAGCGKDVPPAQRREFPAPGRPSRRDRLDRDQGAPGARTSSPRDLPRIPPRRFGATGTSIADFDFEAAAASDYETIVLDELGPHATRQGRPHAKRWQDALALRRAGKSVLGAFNIQHLETVALTAERIIGHPIREIVPLSF